MPERAQLVMQHSKVLLSTLEGQPLASVVGKDMNLIISAELWECLTSTYKHCRTKSPHSRAASRVT